MSLVLAMSAANAVQAGDCRYVESHGIQKSWDRKTPPPNSDMGGQLGSTPGIGLFLGLGMLALVRVLAKLASTLRSLG
jgi:hypothetical protein